MSTRRAGWSADNGYAMAALLVGMTIMAIFLSMALPSWKTLAQREKEAELVFRGEQYARAIALFQRKYANTFPPNVDVLLNEHFLRKKYKDPMTTEGEFQVLFANQQAAAQPGAGTVPTQGQPGRPATGLGNLQQQQQQQQQQGARGGSPVGPQGGIIGVASKSTADSIRIYNGHSKYNEWVFVATQVSNRAGAPTGSQTPTGGINVPGGVPGGIGGRGGRDGRGGPGGFPPGGPGGRGQGNPPQGPFRQGGPGQGGFGGPGQGGFGTRGGGR
jgi:type II secretory pathway pseudopilin PulG